MVSIKNKKAQIGKRYFQVYDAIFQRRIHVLLNYPTKDFVKWAKKFQASFINKMDENERYNNDNFSGFSSSMSIQGEPDEWIICLKHFNWSIADQGSLLHEVVHTIIKIWASNNIPFTPDNQEFLAHSVANLYEDICAKIFYLKKHKT